MKIRTALAALLLVVPALSVAVLAGTTAPAGAAPTTFTWTGAVDGDWRNEKNWSPSDRAPENGDSVVINLGSHSTISDVPDINLAMLTVNGSPEGTVSLNGEGHVFAQQLTWQGGDINVDLTVGGFGAPPSIITPMQTTMRFGSGGDQTLTVVGDLSIAAGFAAGDGPWLTFMFDSDLRVAETGIVRLDPVASLLGSRCCTNHTSTVVVDGTLEVFSITGATGYTAELEQLGLDWAGVVDVPVGNTLRLTGGPVRVGGHAINGTVGNASLRGGGRLDVVETDGDNFDPEEPLEPDGTLKFLEEEQDQRLTVAEDSTLLLGDDTEVSGVGEVTGDGTVLLAGADVRGDLTLDDGIRAETLAGSTSRVVVWEDLAGQRGVLRPEGGLRIVPTSTLSVHGGARLTVPDGARVALQGGATLDADGCCTSLGEVDVDAGGTFAIGGATADPAVLKWVDLGGAGLVTHTGTTELDLGRTSFTATARVTGDGTIEGDLVTGPARVAPAGVLTVDGDWTAGRAGTYVASLPAGRSGTTAPGRLEVTGTAHLAGAIESRGDTRFDRGHRVLALEAGSLEGRFGCARTPGLLPDYTGTAVRLRGIEPRVAGCVVPSSGQVLKATFDGRRTAPLGVPAGTRTVLLQVSLGKARGEHRVRLDSGGGSVVVEARGGRSATAQVALPVSAARRLTATTDRRAAVTATRLGFVA